MLIVRRLVPMVYAPMLIGKAYSVRRLLNNTPMFAFAKISKKKEEKM